MASIAPATSLSPKRKRQLLNDLQRAEQNVQSHAQRWRDYYRAYRAWKTHRDPAKQPWQSDHRVPYIFSQLETLVPRLVDPNPAFDLLPVELSDVELVDSNRILLNNQLQRDNIGSKQQPFLKPAVVFGLSWGKITWKRDERIRERGSTFGVTKVQPKDNSSRSTSIDLPSMPFLNDWAWCCVMRH